MFTKIPESTTEVTILNIANIHTTELGLQGRMFLAKFGGELPELAINAIKIGRNAMVKALVLTALVSF